MRKARLRREQQYMQQRQAQLEEVRAADAKKYALLREDYLAAVAAGMHVCMYACMCVCMHVCVCVCMYV